MTTMSLAIYIFRAHLNEKKYLCYTTTLIDISTRHVHQPAIK